MHHSKGRGPPAMVTLIKKKESPTVILESLLQGCPWSMEETIVHVFNDREKGVLEQIF